MRRGRKKAAPKKTAAAAAVPDAQCPLCGKPVTENSKAFGCSAWREGCRFTLWKNGLTRGGGPMLTEKLVQLILKNGTVQGSTGVIAMKDGRLSFTPNGAKQPSVSFPVLYQKNEKISENP